jgi:5-formyltetrahydrofolate cyclo-ligase
MLTYLKGDFKVISFYISQSWEVSTHKMIEKAVAMGKTIACPKVVGPGLLRHYVVTDLKCCKPSKWGILEPATDDLLEIQPENFDLVFVPGLAFTKEGFRLGYGGGFYDRFLEKVKGDKIGLSFKKQLFLDLPVENHDVQLDLVLSPGDTA